MKKKSLNIIESHKIKSCKYENKIYKIYMTHEYK